MASEKRQSDGIALLSSVYGDDEDEEMEDLNDGGDDEDPPQNDVVVARDGDGASGEEDDSNNGGGDRTDHAATSFFDDGSTPKPLDFRASTPQQSQPSLPSSPLQPPQQQPDGNRGRKGTLTIVDYGHDEVAMSPEAEEGEIVSIGRVMVGSELEIVNGDFQGKTPPGSVQILTPGLQATPPQSSEQLEPLQPDMTSHVYESDSAEVEEAAKHSVEVPEDGEPYDRFLPPPPKDKSSDAIQERIKYFLALKRSGKSFNAEVRNKKEYRNPDFLLHAVMYQDIDQIGSCFSKDVFDPHGYDKSDFYEEIEVDMKREMERKEQERKRSPKVEFMSGGTQIVSSAPKINMPIPGAVSNAVPGGTHSVPTAADAVGRDSRQNKKSKWDKVDGDRRNPLPSGQDSVPTVGAHTALLSAANAGSGYTAFAQQRRREVEVRRTSEKKLERRS